MIHRTMSSGLALVLALGFVACGPRESDENMGEPGADTGAAPAPPAAEPPAGGAPGAMPAWFRVNGNQVQMEITAAGTAGNWTFNGARNGSMTITVPQGAEVTINFKNEDTTSPHSIAALAYMPTWPATPPAEPVFAGAVSPNATSVTDATKAGETATVTFTADKPGEYALVCLVPGHATAGMWVRLNVGGTAGVTGAAAQ